MSNETLTPEERGLLEAIGAGQLLPIEARGALGKALCTLDARAADTSRWQEEWRVTEEARAAFEEALYAEQRAHAETREELRRARVFGNEQERRRRNLNAACEVRANKAEDELAETRAKLEELEKHATLYDQECGMCGADADDLIAFADWQDEHSRSNRLLDRAVLDALSEIDHSRLREWLQDSVNTIHGVGGDDHDRKVIALCRSELARRGEKT